MRLFLFSQMETLAKIFLLILTGGLGREKDLFLCITHIDGKINVQISIWIS